METDPDPLPEDNGRSDFWKKAEAQMEEEWRERLARVTEETMRAAVDVIRGGGPEVRVGRMDFMDDRGEMYFHMYTEHDFGDREPWRVIGDYWEKYGKLEPEMVALGEERAWTLGAVIGPRLGLRLWPFLSARAKAHYLAGTSLLTDIEKCLELLPEYSDTEVQWDVESLAAFVCNAIFFNKNDRFLRAVSGRDLRAMTISRNRDGYHGWVSKDIPDLNRPLVDVFYECALRSQNVPVMKYCLQHGAEPNPLLMFPRYTTRWVTALSYLMEFHTDASVHCGHSRDLEHLILAHHPKPEGHPLEGLHRPLYMAWSATQKDVVDLLLDRGARFEGGFFAREPISEEMKAQVLPYGPHSQATNEFALSAKDPGKLRELWESVNQLIPLTPWHEVPWYEGGWCSYMVFGNFMGTVLMRNDPTYLERYVPRGLPLKLTLPDVVYADRRDPREAFSWVLRAMGLDPNATIARLRNLMRALQPEWHGN